MVELGEITSLLLLLLLMMMLMLLLPFNGDIDDAIPAAVDNPIRSCVCIIPISNINWRMQFPATIVVFANLNFRMSTRTHSFIQSIHQDFPEARTVVSVGLT
jgi:hypothetical protein